MVNLHVRAIIAVYNFHKLATWNFLDRKVLSYNNIASECHNYKVGVGNC